MTVRPDVVGVDLDGTLSKAGLYNPSIELPYWFFIFLLPLITVVRPNGQAIKKIKEIEDCGCKIIIISARPPWSIVFSLTEKWLRFHGVPFHKLFCVGFGKGTKNRKLEIIRKEGIEYFFDDNKKIAAFLNLNSIKAMRL